MSKLHERLLKHKHMSSEEKSNCTCELCKRLNVNKTRRKIEIPVQKLKIPKQKSEVYEQIEKDVTKDII